MNDIKTPVNDYREAFEAILTAWRDYTGNRYARHVCTNFEAGYQAAWDADRWQPIETAPKDGSKILIFIPTQYVELVQWKINQTGEGWTRFGRECKLVSAHKATHWQPLPKGPTKEGE